MTRALATFPDEPEPDRAGRFTVEIGPGCWTSSLAPHPPNHLPYWDLGDYQRHLSAAGRHRGGVPMKPPWWFCCGWWSPWCVLDTAMHLVYPLDGDSLPRWARWICSRHDARITQEALR